MALKQAYSTNHKSMFNPSKQTNISLPKVATNVGAGVAHLPSRLAGGVGVVGVLLLLRLEVVGVVPELLQIVAVGLVALLHLDKRLEHVWLTGHSGKKHLGVGSSDSRELIGLAMLSEPKQQGMQGATELGWLFEGKRLSIVQATDRCWLIPKGSHTKRKGEAPDRLEWIGTSDPIGLLNRLGSVSVLTSQPAKR